MNCVAIRLSTDLQFYNRQQEFFPFAPTNRMSTWLSIFFRALAIATAGKICPPVPPPLIITLYFRCNWLKFWLFFFFCLATNTKYYSYSKAGKPNRCSTHAKHWKRLTRD